MSDAFLPGSARPWSALGAALLAGALSACGGGGGPGQQPPPGDPPALGGRVFMDVNGDKVYDAGDLLVQDVEVTVWDGLAFVAATLSNPDGLFVVDQSVVELTPGTTYELRVLVEQASLLTAADQAFGMGFTPAVLDTPDAGADDTVDSDAVAGDRDGQIHGIITKAAPAAGQADATLGFGFQGVAPPPPPKPTR
ncbi:MAG: hypothetical protein AB7T63_02825 [Planctomycetota bacterium]